MSNSSIRVLDWTIRSYHSGPEWTWELCQWKGNLHSPNLQDYWSLTIKLFSVISRILIVGVLLLCRDAVGVFYSHNRLGWFSNRPSSMPLCLSFINSKIIYNLIISCNFYDFRRNQTFFETQKNFSVYKIKNSIFHESFFLFQKSNVWVDGYFINLLWKTTFSEWQGQKIYFNYKNFKVGFELFTFVKLAVQVEIQQNTSILHNNCTGNILR